MLAKIFPKSLLGRTLLILWGPMFLVQCITTFIFIDRHWYTTTKESAHKIAQKATLIQTLMHDRQEHKITELFQKNFGILVSLHPINTLHQKQHITKTPGIGLLKKALCQVGLESTYIDIDDNKLSIGLTLRQHALYVIMEMPAKRLLAPTTPIFLIWNIATPFLFFLIATLFMRNQIRPIIKLSEAMETFGKGQKFNFLKLSGAKEMRHSATLFNQMQKRITKYIAQRTYMLAGVSHDLKTPLTRMKLMIAMMKESSSTKSLEEEILLMSKIIDDYLIFAQGNHVPFAQTSLIEFMRDVIAPFEKIGQSVRYDVSHDLIIYIQKHFLSRAITNIIENGLKYGKNVSVTTKVRDKIYHIIIDDDGPGIKAEHREKVMQPFVRIDTSRNLNTGGLGLGLAISQDAIAQHGGELKLNHSSLGGLQVIVTLPKLSPENPAISPF